MIFQGIRTSIAKEPYRFVIFQWVEEKFGPLDPRMDQQTRFWYGCVFANAPFNTHAVVSRYSSCCILSLCTQFMYTRNKGSEETADTQSRLSLQSIPIQQVLRHCVLDLIISSKRHLYLI